MEINGVEYYDSLLELPIINYHYILKNIAEPKKAMFFMLKGKFTLKGEVDDEMFALKLLDIFTSFKGEKYEIVGMDNNEITRENLLLRQKILIWKIKNAYNEFNANQVLDEKSVIDSEVNDWLNELDDVCYDLDGTKKELYRTYLQVYSDVIKFCIEINHQTNLEVYTNIVKQNLESLEQIKHEDTVSQDLFDQKLTIERILKLPYSIDLYKTTVIEWFTYLKQSLIQAEQHGK